MWWFKRKQKWSQIDQMKFEIAAEDALSFLRHCSNGIVVETSTTSDVVGGMLRSKSVVVDVDSPLGSVRGRFKITIEPALGCGGKERK